MLSLPYVLRIIKREKLNVDEKIISTKLSQARDLEEFCNSIVDDLLYPDNDKLAVILLMKNHHKKTKCGNIIKFYDTIEKLNKKGIVSSEFLTKVDEKLNEQMEFDILHRNDINFSYLATIMLLKGYLFKIKDEVVECPQYMWLRVAMQLHSNPRLIEQTYNLLTNQSIIHASPTLFNSGARYPQLSSCFLVCLKDDSIKGIYNTISECANISKHGGGLGVCLSNLRSKYSRIESSQNPSKGVIPVLKQLEECARYVDQGGRRLGAICTYFEMTHPEIPDILKIKIIKELPDLFLALWIPDLFMKRVQTKGIWSFFDTQVHFTLTNLYGEEYEKYYEKLENEKAYVYQMDATELFNLILETQVITGGPFMCYKDTANLLSNQKNVGVIHNSNLCTEIFEVASKNETAVCNLASINLEQCVEYEKTSESKQAYVNYDKIAKLTRILTQNLNNTIDKNFYCSEDAKRNNFSLRPIGIGVTGLQGLFFKLKLPLTSPEARKINTAIFEVMYYNALLESNTIAKNKTSHIVKYLLNIPVLREIGKRYLGCYSKFFGSPLSEGKTHIEMFEELTKRKINRFIEKEKWEKLIKEIKKYGVANSLLIALMPTVSTAELVNATDSFEPITGAIVSKSTNYGNFKVVNKYVRELLKTKNAWTRESIESIINHNGSVQQLNCLTDYEKNVFRTAWEIEPLEYMNLALDRAPFIDQSQSLSWYIEDPGSNFSQLGNLHFYAWENRLKTGMYYLRQLPTSQSTNFKKMILQTKTIPQVCNSNCLACE